MGAVAVPVSAETIVRGWASLDSDGVGESGERGAGYPMSGRGSDVTRAAGGRSGGPKPAAMAGERGWGYPMSEPWRKAIGEAAP